MTVPASYALLRRDGIRVAVRKDLEAALASWLLAPTLELPADATPVASGGRGAAFRVRLPDGTRSVVRRYRRGGLLGRWIRETYLGVVARPLRELAVTVEARRRGVAAPEVLAARVEGRFVYRGVLVTAELPDARTLVDALATAPDAAARQAMAASAARAVGVMHRAGVFHADLNMTNLLTRSTAGGVEVAVLDFDRARVGRAPLGARACARNLRRLARSLRKLDPAGRLAGPADVAAFRQAYAVALGAPCAC